MSAYNTRNLRLVAWQILLPHRFHCYFPLHRANKSVYVIKGFQCLFFSIEDNGEKKHKVKLISEHWEIDKGKTKRECLGVKILCTRVLASRCGHDMLAMVFEIIFLPNFDFRFLEILYYYHIKIIQHNLIFLHSILIFCSS